jgi:DNA-binding Lrp family transcriptional regulator
MCVVVVKLDLLDKKIITELNKNVRSSYSEIAKKLKTSKEVINYRIKRLERERIIKEYVTIFGFGYWAHKVLINFSKINFIEDEKILKYLHSNPHINWLTPCTGAWDLVFAIMAKTPKEFDLILREIMQNIGVYVGNYKIGISVGSETFGHTYILNSINEAKSVKKNNYYDIDFDEKDKQIAKLLHQNSRIKLMDIYKQTKIPIDTIKYRIKKMEKNSIIKRYRLILDTSKLGYNRYEVFLRFINLTDDIISKFREYAKENPNIEFFSRCVGSWDIELTVHFENQVKLRSFILDVKEKFGENIQLFETISLFDTQNFVYFPLELK